MQADRVAMPADRVSSAPQKWPTEKGWPLENQAGYNFNTVSGPALRILLPS
jgi:hypothetical protein